MHCSHAADSEIVRWKFLPRGEPVSSIEGQTYEGRMVLLEFPSKTGVEPWFTDFEYQEAMAFRHAASTMHMLPLQERDAHAEDPDRIFSVYYLPYLKSGQKVAVILGQRK